MNEVNGSLSIPWKRLAVAGLLLGLASLAALTVVVSVRGTDALATVALALAILAFISQLLIFSIQTWTAGEHLKRAEELNADTHSLLAEARARIAGTQELVSHHHREFLRIAAAKVTVEEDELGVQSPESGDRGPRARAPHSEVSASGDGHVPDELRELARWPDREAIEAALEVLTPLHPHSLRNFVLSLSRHARGSSVGLPYNSGDDPLMEAGLLVEGAPVTDIEGELSRSVVLTDYGREVGRLLVAPWPPPEHAGELAETIWTIRNAGKAENRLSDVRAFLT